MNRLASLPRLIVAWRKVAARVRLAAVLADEIALWFRTPNAAGKTLQQRIDKMALKYRWMSPDGADGIRSLMLQATADLARKFDDSMIQEGSTRRGAFEALLKNAWAGKLSRLKHNWKREQERRKEENERPSMQDFMGRIFDDPVLARPLIDDLRRISATMPEGMRLGIEAMMESILMGDNQGEMQAAIEEASGMNYRTFFSKLRQNEELEEFLKSE